MWTIVGICVGLAAPVILGAVEYTIEKRTESITLTPREWIANPNWPRGDPKYLVGEKLVDFVPRMQQYTKTAEIAITLASASIVLIPSHLSKLPSLAFSLTLQGFTVLWGVTFIAWMSYCYEQSLYDPASFGARESSTMFALGFGALACFAIGYISLALAVAHAIATGAVLN